MEYPKYLLSLERAIERRFPAIAEMTQMFGEGNYELVNGVDCWKLRDYTDHHGQHFADPEVIKRVEMELGIPFDSILKQECLERDKYLLNNPGTVACSLSHGIILKRFLATGAPVAFIAECDIKFLSSTTIEELDLIAQHLADDDDPAIALTYHHENYHRVYLLKETQVNLLTTALYHPKNPRVVWSTVGYFINRAAAKNILDNMFPIHFVIDWFSIYLKKGWIKKLWCTYPFLVKLSGAKSLSFEEENNKVAFNGLLAPVRIAAHFIAQASIDYDVPVAAFAFQKRRDILYSSHRQTKLV